MAQKLLKFNSDKILSMLISKIQPSKSADPLILRLINKLIKDNFDLVLEKLNEIIAKLLPTFSQVQNDNLRQEYGLMLISCSECFIYALENA
jgi:hypothetical protein